MSTEARLSFTTKVNGDLLTARGDTPGEFVDALLALASDPDIKATIAEIQNVAYATKQLGATVVATGGWQPPEQRQAVQAAHFDGTPEQSGAVGSPGGACEHGQRIWKNGVSKTTNKPWKGWFCPAGERNCQPEWVK